MSMKAEAYPVRTVAAVVAATTAAQVVCTMGATVFPVIAPELARNLGVEASLIGYQMSVIYGAAMLGSMLFTWMVARYGGCRTTQFGMACCVLGMAIALYGGVWSMVVASVFIGAAMSINLPAAAHLLVKALKEPDVKERLAREGAEPVGNSPREFEAFIRNEIVKWTRVVKETGATVD